MRFRVVTDYRLAMNYTIRTDSEREWLFFHDMIRRTLKKAEFYEFKKSPFWEGVNITYELRTFKFPRKNLNEVKLCIGLTETFFGT